MCVQWFQPGLDCVSVEDPEDTQSQRCRAICVLYAFNNKTLDLALNPLSGQVKAGLCHVIESRAQALHEKLMATLETAENDLAPVQTSQAAVGSTEQSRGIFCQNLENCTAKITDWLIQKAKLFRRFALIIRGPTKIAEEDPRTFRRFSNAIGRKIFPIYFLRRLAVFTQCLSPTGLPVHYVSLKLGISILLTVCHTFLFMFVLRIQFYITMTVFILITSMLDT